MTREPGGAGLGIGSILIVVSAREAQEGGRRVALTNREIELLVALGLQPCPRSARWFASVLYDEENLAAGESMVKVYVHRIRRRLGADTVVSCAGGYRLSTRVRVDVCFLEAAVLADRDRLESLDMRQLDGLVAMARQLAVSRPEPLASRRWFAATDARMTATAIDAIVEVAALYGRRGDHRRALKAAALSLASDPYHEPALELAIRSHMALGDRASAALEYRRYRTLLNAQLQLAPSRTISDLLSIAS